MATDSSQTQVQPQSTSFFRRFLNGLWRVIRFLLIIAFLILIGIGIYYGGREFYFSVLSPLNDTISRVDDLEQAIQTERDGMTAQLAQRDERITELESQLNKQKNELKTQQNALDEQQQELDKFATLNKNINTLDKSLKGTHSDLETMQDELITLHTQVTDMISKTDELDDAAERDVKAQNALNKNMSELQEMASENILMLERLHQERLLLHAQANILNAQRSLTRRDLGIANEYLQRADISLKAVNETFTKTGSKNEQASIAIVLTRLDQTMDRLERDPFSAITDLQGVWRALDSVILGDLALDQPLPVEFSSDNPLITDEASIEQNDESDAQPADDVAGEQQSEESKVQSADETEQNDEAEVQSVDDASTEESDESRP